MMLRSNLVKISFVPPSTPILRSGGDRVSIVRISLPHPAESHQSHKYPEVLFCVSKLNDTDFSEARSDLALGSLVPPSTPICGTRELGCFR
jgi:hypothetical protein